MGNAEDCFDLLAELLGNEDPLKRTHFQSLTDTKSRTEVKKGKYSMKKLSLMK